MNYDELQDLRWTEIKFYYLMINIYNINHNIHDVSNFIKLICNMYNPNHYERIMDLAREVITYDKLKPLTKEAALLAYKDGMVADTIINIIGIPKATLYRTVKYQRTTREFPFTPMCPPLMQETLTQFIQEEEKFIENIAVFLPNMGRGFRKGGN